MADQKKVAIFGSTGFVGSNILKELSNNSHSINALIRKGSENKLPKVNDLKRFIGDLSDKRIVQETINKCDTVIYAVGIIREYKKRGITFQKLHYEYFKHIVDIAKSSGVKRIIYISANGVRDKGTKYQITKYKAEQFLIDNFDNWTIFRPSVVFGDPEGKMEFISQLKEDILDKHIPVPLFFRLNPFGYKHFFKSNPVHVEDLAKLVVRSINSISSNNQTYPVGGPIQTTWIGMLKTISNVIEKKKIKLPVPVSAVQMIATIFGGFNLLPITPAQIKMLKENNICDATKLFEEYDIQPIEFGADSIKYLIK